MNVDTIEVLSGLLIAACFAIIHYREENKALKRKLELEKELNKNVAP